MSDEDDLEPKPMEEVLEDVEIEANHTGSQTSLQITNNALIRNQTHQQVRLEQELKQVRVSLDRYTTWSRALTITLVLLGFLSLVAQATIIAIRLGWV